MTDKLLVPEYVQMLLRDSDCVVLDWNGDNNVGDVSYEENGVRYFKRWEIGWKASGAASLEDIRCAKFDLWEEVRQKTRRQLSEVKR